MRSPLGHPPLIGQTRCRATGQQRKHWHPRFVQAKDQAMRDFSDAKTMAHTLRASLAATAGVGAR
jgi:hypothetical protein